MIEEDQDQELQKKYDRFRRWLQAYETENSSEIRLLCSEDTDNFQDTIEIEDEDNIFLDPLEPVEEVEEKKEKYNHENKETNIFLKFSLNKRPSVLEILGIPENDHTPKSSSEMELWKPPDYLETPVDAKPLSHNKGKAPKPPQLPTRKHETTSITPIDPLTNSNKVNQRGLSSYIPSVLIKSDGNKPSSNSTDDFGRETQI